MACDLGGNWGHEALQYVLVPLARGIEEAVEAALFLRGGHCFSVECAATQSRRVGAQFYPSGVGERSFVHTGHEPCFGTTRMPYLSQRRSPRLAWSNTVGVVAMAMTRKNSKRGTAASRADGDDAQDHIVPDKKLKKKVYEKELARLQVELVKLQE